MRIFTDGDSGVLSEKLKRLGVGVVSRPDDADLIYRVGAFRNAERTVSVLTAEGGGTRAWPFRLAEEIMRSRIIGSDTDSFLRLDRQSGGSPTVISDILLIGPSGPSFEAIMDDTARVLARFAEKDAGRSLT